MVYGKYNYSIHGGYFMVNQKKQHTHHGFHRWIPELINQPGQKPTNQQPPETQFLAETQMASMNLIWWVNGG